MNGDFAPGAQCGDHLAHQMLYLAWRGWHTVVLDREGNEFDPLAAAERPLLSQSELTLLVMLQQADDPVEAGLFPAQDLIGRGCAMVAKRPGGATSIQ